MQIGKAITYPFEDRRWLSKVLIGLAISLVPILNLAFWGYMIEIVRRMSRQESEILPEWDNVEKRFIDGLLVTLAYLIYSLPLILCCVLALAPLLPQFLSDSLDPNAVDTLTGIGMIALICAAGAWILYSIALSLLHPAIMLRYARYGNFGACFQLGEIWRAISKDFGNYLTLWLSIMGVGLVAGIVIAIAGGILSLIPCIGTLLVYAGALFAGVYINLVYAHLIGQFALSNPEPDALTQAI